MDLNDEKRTHRRLTRNGQHLSERQPDLRQVINDLTRRLGIANAKIAELTQQLERQSASMREQDYASRSAAAFIEADEALTSRERQVLLYFVKHRQDKEVAVQLGTKPQTVRNQIRSIMRKLGLRSRTDLMAVLLSQQSRRSSAHS